MTIRVKNVVNVVVVNLVAEHREVARDDKPASAGKFKKYVSVVLACMPLIVKLAIKLIFFEDFNIDV